MTIPSSDLAFAAAIRRVALDLDQLTPAALQAGIRVVYPNAVVRTRELSAEPKATLYAYRDGSFLPATDADWTDGPDVPWAAFDPATGEIVDANDALARLLGVTGSVVGRLVREFVPEGADRISDEQLGAIAASGGARSTGLARREDGSRLHVEFVARAVGGRLEAWYRETPAD